MEKFIQIPVGSDNLIFRASGIAKIVPGGVPATQTSITYLGGASVQLTHAATTGNAFVESVEAAVADALVTTWEKPIFQVAALEQAVSAIASL